MSVGPQRLLLLLSALGFNISAGYSNGNVENACKSMAPEHGYPSRTDMPPYRVTVSNSTFNPGEQITVNLSASGTTYFEGFLIEVRDIKNPDGEPVGTFTHLNHAKSKFLACGHNQASAVSHIDASKKSSIQVTWNAPESAPPSVQFLATVVQRYHVYWVRIPGPVLSRTSTIPAPLSPSSMAPTLITVATPSHPVLQPFSSEECGRRKSCLRDPIGCDPGEDPSCFFLSFATEGEKVLFELSGPADGYISFALSLDKWMGNDDVYLCVRDGTRVDVSAAYLGGRTHPEQSSQSVLTDVAGSWSDGVIGCQFRRTVHMPQEPSRFDLNEKYYLFMAHGRADNGGIHRHDHQPLISTNQKVISGTPENLSGSRSPVIMKIHGAFMLIAWMTAVSAGIMIARYFRNTWMDKALFSQTVWFQVHRGLMMSAVLLTFLGFILPFVYRSGWSRRAGLHPYLGCIVMALALLQPLMAVLRPPPDAERRWIFNRMHLGVGTVVEIIAVVTMFLGIHQQALLLPGPGSTCVLAAAVVWGVGAHLVLEFHSRGLLRMGKARSADQEAILSELKVTDSKEIWFKKVVLAIYLCGNFGFLAALLSIIRNV